MLHIVATFVLNNILGNDVISLYRESPGSELSIEGYFETDLATTVDWSIECINLINFTFVINRIVV